jgi:hypothetical protein
MDRGVEIMQIIIEDFFRTKKNASRATDETFTPAIHFQIDLSHGVAMSEAALVSLQRQRSNPCPR